MVDRGLLDKVSQLKPASENEKTIILALMQLLQRAINQDERRQQPPPPRRDAMEDKD